MRQVEQSNEGMANSERHFFIMGHQHSALQDRAGLSVNLIGPREGDRSALLAWMKGKV